MTSLPELPSELQRFIRERVHRKSSLAEAQVLTGKAIAAETRRVPGNDIRASDVKGRRPTVKLAQVRFCCEEPDVLSRRTSNSGLYASDTTTRQPHPDSSIAEPSFHSRPGTGTVTGSSHSPFRDAGPDEISSINRYRSYCHPPRPLRSRASSTGGYYPSYLTSSSSCHSPSPLPPYSTSPPNPFSVVACHLLPRTRDINSLERPASTAGLPWQHSDASASEGFPAGAELTSSIRSGALKGAWSKSGPPVRRTCSAPPPPRHTVNVFYDTDRGVKITRDPSFDRQTARSIAPLNKLCMSITKCSIAGEGRPTAGRRSGSIKSYPMVSRQSIIQQEAKKLVRKGKNVFMDTDGVEASLNEEVPTNEEISGTVTSGTVTVSPVKPGTDSTTNGTDSVNCETKVMKDGRIFVKGGIQVTDTNANVSVPVNEETKMAPDETGSVDIGTDVPSNGTILNKDETSTASNGTGTEPNRQKDKMAE